jgi:hypothetical protein
MHHIIILLHKYDTFEKSRYFLHEIAEIWREEGLRVSVLNGPGSYVDADLAIMHVDLTVVPADYLAFVRQYPVIINGSVTDISKRLISTNLVCRDDSYQGQVIVKANQNCGGAREVRIARMRSLLGRYNQSLREEARLARMRSLLGRYYQFLRDKLPLISRSGPSISDYTIFKSTSQVPRVVWDNPDLVVERFLPERRDSLYCLRTWIFLGDRETNSLYYSLQPIVKSSSNIVRREMVAEVPEELRQMRQNLGFDFGKFDYVIADRQVILYDANRTPTLGSLSKDQFMPRIRLLAKGIHAYL